MKTILFICTGNSCRSVMAAEMFKKMLGVDNDKIRVLSAGVGTAPGMHASDYTIKVLQREGVDATKHRSVAVSKNMIQEADLVITMERYHKNRILEIDPGAKGKVYVLRELGKAPDEIVEPEILDPIGRPMEVYERSLALIIEGLENLINWMKKEGWI